MLASGSVYDTTPRGRRNISKGIGSAPGGRGNTPNNSCWKRAGDTSTPLRDSQNERRRHYMPRQGLFEGEHVLDMFDHSSDDDDERSCPPSVLYQSRSSPYNIPSSSAPIPRHFDEFNAATPVEPSINFVSLFQEQQAMLKSIMNCKKVCRSSRRK